MTNPDAESILLTTHREIGRLLPTALDMIATVVEDPGGTLENYDRLLTVAEAESPLLLLAVLRAAAGFAAVMEATPEDIRAFGTPTPDSAPVPD